MGCYVAFFVGEQWRILVIFFGDVLYGHILWGCALLMLYEVIFVGSWHRFGQT